MLIARCVCVCARACVNVCVPVPWVLCTVNGSAFFCGCVWKNLCYTKNFPFTLKWIPALSTLPACILLSIQPFIHPSTSSLAPFSSPFFFHGNFSCSLYHPYRHMHTSIWCVGQHTVLHISQTLSCHLLFLTPVKLFGEIFHTKKEPSKHCTHTRISKHTHAYFHPVRHCRAMERKNTGQKYRIIVI